MVPWGTASNPIGFAQDQGGPESSPGKLGDTTGEERCVTKALVCKWLGGGGGVSSGAERTPLPCRVTPLKSAPSPDFGEQGPQFPGAVLLWGSGKPFELLALTPIV